MHLWYARAPSTTGGVIRPLFMPQSRTTFGPTFFPPKQLIYTAIRASTILLEIAAAPLLEKFVFVFYTDADLCRVIGLLLAQVAIYEKWKTRETEAGMQLKQSILDGPEW